MGRTVRGAFGWQPMGTGVVFVVLCLSLLGVGPLGLLPPGLQHLPVSAGCRSAGTGQNHIYQTLLTSLPDLDIMDYDPLSNHTKPVKI